MLEVVGDVAGVLIQVFGSLGLFLFGMRVMSEGIQKAAGDRLQSILHLMTANRFTAILTGFLVTVLVQSSSASTVMVVGFVNAGLLTLAQSIGMIFGANIGTTVTGWIVAFFGFRVNIAAASFPAIALGALLIFNTKWRKSDWGEALLGFGLLFLGLMFLKDSLPDVREYPQVLEFIGSLSGAGIWSLLLFIVIGTLFTFILQSSSAAMTVTLTMAHAGWIDYPTATAIVLGENIGTTATAWLASLGADVNARRASRAHTVFNLLGVLWMLVLFVPFLHLVDWIVPGEMWLTNDPELLPAHLAAFHTIFNVTNTLLFMPWLNTFSKFIEKLVPEPKGEISRSYSLAYLLPHVAQNPELYLLQIRDEVNKMASLVSGMYQEFAGAFSDPERKWKLELERFKELEDQTDIMEEQLSVVLSAVATDRLNPSGISQVNCLLRVVNEWERIADTCYHLAHLAERREKKSFEGSEEGREELQGFIELTSRFINFIQKHFLKPLDAETLELAYALEKQVDERRDALKKSARKRLAKGAGVKAELMQIDMLNQLEHIGDFSLNIARAQRELPRSLEKIPVGVGPQPSSSGRL